MDEPTPTLASLTAYRTPAGIYLSRDAYVALPWRDSKGVSSTPKLTIEVVLPTQLGEALRRAFVFCDMSE